MKPSVQEIRLGAIYLFGAKRALSRETVEALLVGRAGFKADTARVLAGHWFTTGPYRGRIPSAPTHNWVPSPYGHGETACTRCGVTNREAAALGILNTCNLQVAA